MNAPDPAARLVAELTEPLGVAALPVDVAAAPASPPVPALLAALAVAEAYSGTPMPGAEVLGAWEAHAEPTAQAEPAFRILPAADGWVALTLSRPHDLQLVPALVSRNLAPGEDPGAPSRSGSRRPRPSSRWGGRSCSVYRSRWPLTGRRPSDGRRSRCVRGAGGHR